jgi:hypothetical protein
MIADNRLFVAKMVALFCALGAATYGIAQQAPSPLAAVLLQWAPTVSVLLWLQRDTHRTGVAAVHDSGFLLAIISIVFIPWYAWKTRGGWAGWRLALLLFLLMGAADVGRAVGAALVLGL